MTNDKKTCDLCGLAVEIKDFHLHTTEGEKEFCCDGCQGIYQMLHEDLVLPNPIEKITH
jgi:hypothetical protein